MVEYLTQFRADGELDCQMSEVESEHTAMSILTGASLTGVRCYTATSSQGLALMYEPYFRASTLRLPIVMNIVNREMISPQTVWGGPQDSLSVRDAGWIQIYVEDNQEILDMTIQAFRIAEDERVLLPVNVCYDGFYLSHHVGARRDSGSGRTWTDSFRPITPSIFSSIPKSPWPSIL